MSKLVYFTGDIALVDNLGIEECISIQEVLKKLHEYEIAEEQGLLLRLPCKVGDTIWEAGVYEDTINECILTEFAFDEENVLYVLYDLKDGVFSAKRYLDAFGDTLFLTKEEAEQKVAEIRGDNNGKM
jgi:hypothetical protein